MHGKATVVVVLTRATRRVDIDNETVRQTGSQAVRQSGRSMTTTIRRAAVCPLIDRRRLRGLAARRTARQCAARCRQWFVIRCWPRCSLSRHRRSTADIARAPTDRYRPTSSSTTIAARLLSQSHSRVSHLPSCDARVQLVILHKPSCSVVVKRLPFSFQVRSLFSRISGSGGEPVSDTTSSSVNSIRRYIRISGLLVVYKSCLYCGAQRRRRLHTTVSSGSVV